MVISGPSGAGKGTVVAKVMARRPDVFLSVSATTRPARRGEVEGVDYHFISERDFVAGRDRGDYLEAAEVYGNLYGTPRRPVEEALQQGRDVILEVDIQGALAVKRAEPEAVLVFIEPPSFEELSSRLRGRGTEDPDSLRRRARAAHDEVREKDAFDHVVVNDRIEDAVEAVLRILESPQPTR